MQPVIAISIGDVHGVGPEVALKAFQRSDLFETCRPVFFGPLQAVKWYKQNFGLAIHLDIISNVQSASEGRISLIDTGGTFDPTLIGKPTITSGQMSLLAIEAAFEAVAYGAAQALVTSPISKEAIALAGSAFKGHTDLLATRCGACDEVIMILSSNTMNVGLVTIHIPLREVATAVTESKVYRTILAAQKAMEQDFAISSPHIAVLALNPHGSDGGTLGNEENEIIRPAMERVKADGIRCDGPFPADGFFSAHNKDMYDIIIAMYHDQGLIPFKLQAHGRGVNISSGLPIIRTSPDHGTAYNIAGRGIASPESMREAIRTARTIAVNRSRFLGDTTS